jgi:two-component system, NtrC family, sensor histidine kinase PilS
MFQCLEIWLRCRRGACRGSCRLFQPQDGSAAYLDVIDCGPGITPELQAQLFDPFNTTSAQGIGLGLFIARELCQANCAI